MAIGDHVNVTVTATTVTPSRPSFGTPLVAAYLGASPPWTDRVRSYTSLSSAVSDGIADAGDTRACYQTIARAFSQNPRPTRVKVGRLTTQPVPAYLLTVTSAAVGAVMRATINGVSVSVTQSSTNTTTEATALNTAITAIAATAGISNAPSTNTISIAPSPVNGRRVRFSGLSSNLTFADNTADPSTSADLAAIKAADNDWYSLTMAGTGKAELLAAAAWCEADGSKRLIQHTAESACFDSGSTTDVMATAKTNNYRRSAFIYCGDSFAGSGAAWASRCLAKDPGTLTWKFKTLAGVAADDQLTDTQRNNIKNKNGNIHVSDGGVTFTQEGKCADGTFIDADHGLDWLKSELQVTTLSILASADKVPYTKDGTAMIEAGVRRVLAEAERRGYLAAGWTVTAIDPATLDPSVRATRIYSGIQFAATGAGALHGVNITGTVGA